MYSVAILYICTGKYSVLWEGFYQSFKEHFLKNSKIDYYVFTDAKLLEFENNEDVHKIYQNNLGWPGNTLRRFDIFLTIEKEISKKDFIFFVNANMRCVTDIEEKDFLPLLPEEELVMVKHAGYYNQDVGKYPYEKNPESLACVPNDMAKYYVMGSLNGGKSKAYLQLIHTLSENIETDYQKGIIAVWHDESHLNHYLLGRNDVKLLPPCYCADVEKEYSFEPKMVLLNKSKFFNVHAIKSGTKMGWIKDFVMKVRNHIAH